MTPRVFLQRFGGTIAVVGVLSALGVVYRRELAVWFSYDTGRPSPAASASARGEESAVEPGDIDHYTCPMHPSVHQQAPGKCPICGMDLVPVTKAEEREGVVVIDDARRQLIGVTTAPVAVAPMQGALQALGRVAYDESSLTDVSLKVRGWITKLFVNETGQKVVRGQPLFLVYSPELYNAQQDFLLSTQGTDSVAPGADGKPSRLELLGRAARQRLRLLGLDDGQIDSIQKKGSPLESISIGAPSSGVVIEKNVVDGASFDAGMRLYRIAALGKVWVEADVYERDLPNVHVGQSAHVTLDYVPGRTYDAKVTYVYPYLDTGARTGKVRLEIANKDLELKPGMYARVELEGARASSLQVPVSAVVYTGPRRLVFRDLGHDRFRPQEISVGREANGMYEVLSGLAPGDVVATSGVFLIAAEARLSGAGKYWAAPSPSGSSASSDAAPNGAPGTDRSAVGLPKDLPRVEPASIPPRVRAESPNATSHRGAPGDRATIYTCPMHPEVRQTSPGKCPICGMDLVPATEGPKK